jgi:hypothetical protein
MKKALALSPVVTRMLIKNRGVKFRGQYYWAPEFADERLRRQKLTLFPDVIDENLCHVELEGKWVRCVPTTERGLRPRAFWN